MFNTGIEKREKTEILRNSLDFEKKNSKNNFSEQKTDFKIENALEESPLMDGINRAAAK